ncbi:MAG: biopolymer transporter ExbD [Puia sp.]|nr:biopolymer transporter ExbD [Puia sp.]
MAEVNTQAGISRKGVRRSQKLSTRVDLTPMVDLGFLLITFFILTTTWSKPRTTELRMPADGDPATLGKDAALTVLAVNNNKVFYYHGDWEDALRTGNYGTAGYGEIGGIGEIIRRKQEAMDRSFKGGRKEMMVLIKPSAEANYKNVVGLLDEMLINGVSRYAIVDLNPEEKNLLTARNL